MLPDIQTRDDIQQIVDAFYGDIHDDDVLGRFFAALDLEAHRPRMVAFWSSVVFQTGTYRGRPFDAHVSLPGLEPVHFQRWLERFVRVVDERFAGDAAERIKQRANQIALIFQIKLGFTGVVAQG